MTFPSIFVSTLIIGVLAILQHIALHLGEFNISEAYIPLAGIVVTGLITMFQQYQKNQPVSSAARGMETSEKGYWARVFYK